MGPVEVFSGVVAFVVIFLSQWIYRWRNPKVNGLRLPPGSSGLPLIGETLELIKPNYSSYDVHPFIKKRQKRYGPLFRSNIAGHNVVISTDKDFNNFLLLQEDKLVARWYLNLFKKLFQDIHSQSAVHKYVRNLVLSQYGVECLKQNQISQFEALARRTLQSWSSQDSLELKSAAIAMYGEYTAMQLDSGLKNSKDLVETFIQASRGLYAFPLNIPGTTFNKCLKAKDRAMKMIKEIVKTKLSSPQKADHDDILSKMIKTMTTVEFVTEAFMAEILFATWYAASDSISSILTFCLKFLTENPDVMQELIAEHEGIMKKRQHKRDSPLTWEDYKSMTFTLQVVNETFRLATTTPGFLRKAIKDIQVNGCTIPAGWGIMIYHRSIHLDPDTYKDPLKFDPWRWTGVGSDFISKNLVPFGGGAKQCAGADFSRASVCIFLHILVTKYRWSIVKGGEAIESPVLHFKNGLHINVSERLI